jgi:hypothetical protein
LASFERAQLIVADTSPPTVRRPPAATIGSEGSSPPDATVATPAANAATPSTTAVRRNTFTFKKL